MEFRSDIALHIPFLEEEASKVGFIIELGLGFGDGSTVAFDRGLKRSASENKLHIGVDKDPGGEPQWGYNGRLEQEKRLVWTPPISNYWHLVIGASEIPATMLEVWEICAGRAADIIFVDTLHEYEQLKKELVIWSCLASDKTLWIFHDIFMGGQYNRMTDAILEYCRDYPDWEYIEHSRECNGLGLMRRRK